ncbi:hypothetical protein DWW99_05440 [[Clostridium] leptum]|nr:hypothetical protein DWW99_05440 [[Clostridium] leptum]
MVTQNADNPAVHISSGKSCCRLGLQRDVGFYHCGVCRSARKGFNGPPAAASAMERCLFIESGSYEGFSWKN